MKDVLVVGAGPAGMMAAITAAENGARVTLLEKMQRVGRKMLITGKGRCNLTNAAPVPELIRQFNADKLTINQKFFLLPEPESTDTDEEDDDESF